MTRTTRRMLAAHKDFRHSPPSLVKLVRRLLRPWLLLFVICGVLMGLGVATEIPLVTGLGLGMFVGCVARDFGWCLKTVQAWPTTKEIVNWERVDQLLIQDPDAPG